MDALSSKMFQPIQPDDFHVLSSLGKDAPKIQITETDGLCQGPLSPASCDGALCDWDDLHHHGDHAGDCVSEGSVNHHHHDSADHRRGSLSRRSEGGPGKCPSPSRNSPRRHSPVPYSPKRQNRTRSSASSVASEEFGDVSLSPRRHSPVPGSPHAERPNSLSLASGSGEEFICVSYADPFSSPTITHTSEGILAISINCSHEQDDHKDVEMTPQDSRPQEAGGGSHSAGISAANGVHPATSADSSEPFVQQEEGLQGNVFEAQVGNNRCSSGTSVQAGGNDSAFNAQSARFGGGDYQAAVASSTRGSDLNCGFGAEGVEAASSWSSTDADDGLRGVESMEGDFRVDDVTDSESSSDEEIVDFVSPPHDVSMSIDFSCPHIRSRHAVTFHDHCCSLAKCSRHQEHEHPCEAGSGSYRQAGGTPAQCVNTPTAAVCVKRSGSGVSQCPVQSLPSEARGPLCSEKGCWAGRRASCPDHHSGTCSSPLSPCSSKDASPTGKSVYHVSKSPEDFALCCVVGSPPLTFPHCQHVLLVHCSLPSPYDPSLPTPPIVLTPHTSYDDLNLDPITYDAPPLPPCPPPTVVRASSDAGPRDKGTSSSGGEDVSFRRPDITRSRSFPKLNQDDGQFREPDQAWPMLGEVQEGVDSGDTTADDHTDLRRQWDSRRSSDSGCGRRAEVSDMGEEGVATSVSLPGSPSNSRAAVIGRLRRVVERRLSATSDSMEGALSEEERR